MNRVIWSMGGTGLVLAGLTAAWLHRPLEPRPHEELAPLALAPPPLPSAEPHTASGPPGMVDTSPTPPPTGASLDAVAPTPPEPPPASRGALPARARRNSSPTRVRMVAALRGEHASAESRRDAVLAELVATGGSQEPWTEDARAALETWRARIEEEVLPVRAEPARCFAAGCVARVTFPDAASFEASFQRTPGLRLGPGGAHLQLPPERLPSGEVVASWVVLRPDAP